MREGELCLDHEVLGVSEFELTETSDILNSPIQNVSQSASKITKGQAPPN